MGRDGKDTLLEDAPPLERKPETVANDDPFEAFDGLISYLLDQILRKHKKDGGFDDSTVDLLKKMVEIRRLLNE